MNSRRFWLNRGSGRGCSSPRAGWEGQDEQISNAIFLPIVLTRKQKVWSAVTDPARIRKTDLGHPEVCTVYAYHQVFNKAEIEEVELTAARAGLAVCSENLPLNSMNYWSPCGEDNLILSNLTWSRRDILQEGTRRVQAVEKETMLDVRSAMKIN